MSSPLLLIGLVVAAFVAYNIGGATTGPAFGPAVGARVISKTAAATLMSVFFFLGAWTIGPRVVDTLGTELVDDPGVFSLQASIGVLFFIGASLLIGNLAGVPASTSMTAVGSIAGLGLATGQLNWAVLGEIVAWWIVAPVIGFWVSGVIGRYFYDRIAQWIAIGRSDGPLLTIGSDRRIPTPTAGPDVTPREVIGATVVVGIGCLMAFSSGTSNIANAIAPLVGSGAVGMRPAILLGGLAVTVGTLTIARRTMETLGNDITDLPLTAAIVVAVISSVIVVFLSAIGIPASFVVIATMNIVGLGWGRATRTARIGAGVRGEDSPRVSVGALATEAEMPTVGNPEIDPDGMESQPIGEQAAEDIPRAAELFDPATTGRVIMMQNIVPILATLASFTVFRLTLNPGLV